MEESGWSSKIIETVKPDVNEETRAAIAKLMNAAAIDISESEDSVRLLTPRRPGRLRDKGEFSIQSNVIVDRLRTELQEIGLSEDQIDSIARAVARQGLREQGLRQQGTEPGGRC